MKEIKLTIDGKEVQLTDEQIKALNLTLEPNPRNPFARVDVGTKYFYIDSYSSIHSMMETHDGSDNRSIDCCNYFNDKDFAKQVALHQLLYRKLLKFAYDNGYEDTVEWDESNGHWTIRYAGNRYGFCAYSQERYKAQDVYFSSEDAVMRAIKEVVEPFVKEHPDFVW